MATYKVIQDVEAEDHILGPLTLRQFIYGLVTVFLGYMSFLAIAKNFLIVLPILVPPAALAGFFAFPFKRDQPTEVWALAKLRFMVKPRRRLWNQSGVKELVSITVPKKPEKPLTNGLTPDEVRNRLQALAETIDSRGWVVKNVTVMPGGGIEPGYEGDRLLDLGSIPKPVPDYEVTPDDDILDEQSRVSSLMSNMIEESSHKYHQHLVDSLKTPQPKFVPDWFTPQSERQLSSELKRRSSFSNIAITNMHNSLHVNTPAIKTVRGISARHESPIPALPPQPPVASASNQTGAPAVVATQPSTQQTAQPPITTDPAILNLVYNDDLNIATLAHEANRNRPPDEVVINLH